MDELEYEAYMRNSKKSSWSAMRTSGRNRRSDETVSDECGSESNEDWTQDAM